MVPPAWRCLIRQAERPDQVAIAIVCPRGAPLPGGDGGGCPPPPPHLGLFLWYHTL